MRIEMMIQIIRAEFSSTNQFQFSYSLLFVLIFLQVHFGLLKAPEVYYHHGVRNQQIVSQIALIANLLRA